MIENHNKKNIARVIEALIFASTKPVSSKELSPYLEEFELNDIIEIIEKGIQAIVVCSCKRFLQTILRLELIQILLRD